MTVVIVRASIVVVDTDPIEQVKECDRCLLCGELQSDAITEAMYDTIRLGDE